MWFNSKRIERETLKVDNFLVLKKADFDVKKINIIIGPQTEKVFWQSLFVK
jgi:hypothetical protein